MKDAATAAPTPTETETRSLYDVSPSNLATLIGETVSPSFRIRQVADWLYQKDVASFESMTNLPPLQREELDSRFSIDLPEIVRITDPAADQSRKFLFRLADGALIEAVYMPMGGGRTTLCLSSQAGCAVGCTFCVTGFFGAGRNLRPSEIIGQVRAIRRTHPIPSTQLNVVFMGMGEPLLNLDHVRTALDILGESISLRRVTLSTSGIVPGIREMARWSDRPNLAISVNAPDQERREKIMPITRKYPLTDLLEALREYPLERDREITAEYVLLEGFNDSREDAHALADLLRGLKVKVNAIPFNPDPQLPDWMKRPDDQAIERFLRVLVKRDVPVTVRRSRGDDIAAACGQLRGQTEKRRR